MNTTEYALQKIGLKRPTWQTVVASASGEVALPRKLLWEVWMKLEDWPSWSRPLHVSARWTSEPGWKAGATFEQTLDLGFPLGRTVSPETVGAIANGELVSWWKEANGIKSCHVWEFSEPASGRTRVTNTEVFHGPAIGFIKPFAAGNWQKMFEATVAGLLQAAQARRKE